MTDPITLFTLQAEYTQDSDSNQDDIGQSLNITYESSGGGYYYTIKTDRWAFDKIEDLRDILKDFDKRIKVGIQIEKE